MAYNNGFINNGYQMYPQYYPYSYYQQQYQQPQNPQATQQPIAQSTNVNNGMTWVQGIGGAKSFLVAPNATVILWDSEAPVIYLKSADASGMPSMRILDYTMRDEQKNNNTLPVSKGTENDSIFATKEDLNAIRKDLEQFKSRIDNLSNLNRKERKEYKNE